jgi:hypothetical protein
MRFAILAASTLALSGCGGITLFGQSDADRPACPQVRPYEQGFRDGLAAEVERLPDGSPMRVAIADYWMLRADAISCGSR